VCLGITTSTFTTLLQPYCAPSCGHPNANRSCHRAQTTPCRVPPPTVVAKPPPSTTGQATGACGFVQSRGASPTPSLASLAVDVPLNLAAALPSWRRSWLGHHGQALATPSPSTNAPEPPDAPSHLPHRWRALFGRDRPLPRVPCFKVMARTSRVNERIGKGSTTNPVT
jgi:hypothetical protein